MKVVRYNYKESSASFVLELSDSDNEYSTSNNFEQDKEDELRSFRPCRKRSLRNSSDDDNNVSCSTSNNFDEDTTEKELRSELPICKLCNKRIRILSDDNDPVGNLDFSNKESSSMRRILRRKVTYPVQLKSKNRKTRELKAYFIKLRIHPERYEHFFTTCKKHDEKILRLLKYFENCGFLDNPSDPDSIRHIRREVEALVDSLELDESLVLSHKERTSRLKKRNERKQL